ncbi:hypothetical protein HAX54_039451 [Datura stramonium]|uniref:Peptidase S8/S53 domain-containing protein n=1 Tax=Datura stramonium TaxID=4076 RepID=A0ABS8VM00_DATST|nr:hypothetical protein [Datura stramonium]
MVFPGTLNVDKMAAVGTDACPAVKIQNTMSCQHSSCCSASSIDISLELSGIGPFGRKRNWPAQMFNILRGSFQFLGVSTNRSVLTTFYSDTDGFEHFGHEEVVSVFPDPMFELHTTRSWDFLGSYYSTYPYNYNDHPSSSSSHDVIIGLIDTGIWPESPSFDDQHIGEIPSRWKGVCMEGFDFDKSKCNSYYGLASGIARGGSPSARIVTLQSMFRGKQLSRSRLLKAIDDAIRDGVDIISISMGRSFVFQTDFKDDPIAIGAFHAAERGVAVVCSGGNEGPDPYTVTNSAPWIFTGLSPTSLAKSRDIPLAPDITAPGVGILSAMIPNEDEKESSLFSITSGTSMACPHVSGTMAFIKSIHPTWSFSMITCYHDNSPPGLIVRVSPRMIGFVKGIKTASFQVSFDGKKASKGYNFGSIPWSDVMALIKFRWYLQ